MPPVAILIFNAALYCRKRPLDAPVCTRNNFVAELKHELHQALKILQQSSIAPVDLAQAAIGPGIKVYSRYSAILKADGTEMTVREALQRINQELDAWLTTQEGELDVASRFCLALFEQNGYNTIPFGEANVLANAKNISVESLKEMDLVFAEKGQVHLLEREQLPQFSWETEDSSDNCVWLLAQQLIHTLEKEGMEGCAKIIARLPVSSQRARDLVYNLYSICERKGWNSEAQACNALVMAWPEIRQKLGESKISTIYKKLL